MAPVPPVVAYRSVYRGQVIFAQSCWVLYESPDEVVTAVVPGATCRWTLEDRLPFLKTIADGRAQLVNATWHTHRFLWWTRFAEPWALGHIWDAASGTFKGYYVNLQDPLRKSACGFESLDHVLDIVVEPDGRTWHWKDEDELVEAVRVGMFTSAQADAIHRAGERAIASLRRRLPTGWESWRPDPGWPPPRAPLD